MALQKARRVLFLFLEKKNSTTDDASANHHVSTWCALACNLHCGHLNKILWHKQNTWILNTLLRCVRTLMCTDVLSTSVIFYKSYVTIECVGLRILFQLSSAFFWLISVVWFVQISLSTETGIFHNNDFHIKGTDVLAPCVSRSAGPWFNIKMSFLPVWQSHCGDKTIVRSSYLHNGISYTGKMNLFIESGPWGIFPERFTRRNSNSMQNWFQCISIVGSHFVTIFAHTTTAQLS